MGFSSGTCTFCGQTATSKNNQKFAVCRDHKDHEFPDMKCSCNGYLDVKESKYGAFFICMDCGPVSVSKAKGINEEAIRKSLNKEQTNNNNSQNKSRPSEPKKVREITVRSDEVDFI